MKVFNNKKGSAMPLAIFFVTFCLLFSTLVVVVSFRLRVSTKAYEDIYDKEINSKFVFDEMGESFFRAIEEHKTEDEIKNAVINASGYTAENFPYDIDLLYYSNLDSIIGENKDDSNLLYEIKQQLNTQKKATTNFGIIVQNTVNALKSTINSMQQNVSDFFSSLFGRELEREPTLDELLTEYNKSLTGLKSLYELKLMPKGSEDELALDVAIGVEYIDGDSPGVGDGNSAYADLSEKYTVLNWSNQKVKKANLPEGFNVKELKKVFETTNDTVIVGEEVGLNYDNLLIVRVVNGIINLFR